MGWELVLVEHDGGVVRHWPGPGIINSGISWYCLLFAININSSWKNFVWIFQAEARKNTLRMSWGQTCSSRLASFHCHLVTKDPCVNNSCPQQFSVRGDEAVWDGAALPDEPLAARGPDGLVAPEGVPGQDVLGPVKVSGGCGLVELRLWTSCSQTVVAEAEE